jgi:hypothetical protein
MKQLRYYEMLPLYKDETAHNEVTIEALDDALLFQDASVQPFKEPDAVAVFEYEVMSPGSSRRNPRKQKIEPIKIASVQREKFQCCKCGLALANNVTLRRHTERVIHRFILRADD